MFVATATRTMQGAARRAKERKQAAQPVSAAILPFKRPSRVYEPIKVPSAYEVSRARHIAFLASIDIATETPIRKLVDRVAAWHGFTAEQMIRPSRVRTLVAARSDCIAAVKSSRPNLSLPQLGKIFGGRDHTTIMHYLRKRGL